VDLLAEINTFAIARIKAKGLSAPYATPTQGYFPGASSEEIVYHSDPSQAVITRYLDGSEEGEQLLTYLFKSVTQKTARDEADKFRGVLDLAEMQQLTGAVFGKIEPQAAPCLVSKSEAKEWGYSVSFRLEYDIMK
jgi:hypothetical protein